MLNKTAGTGVPICLAGAKLTTNQILADLGMTSPWEQAEQEKARIAASTPTKYLDIDRSKPNKILVLLLMILLAAIITYTQAQTGRGLLF